MQVRIYEYTDDHAQIDRGTAELRQAMGDDEAGYEPALDEIRRAGRVWVGGGAAPLFLLMRI